MNMSINTAQNVTNLPKCHRNATSATATIEFLTRKIETNITEARTNEQNVSVYLWLNFDWRIPPNDYLLKLEMSILGVVDKRLSFVCMFKLAKLYDFLQ